MNRSNIILMVLMFVISVVAFNAGKREGYNLLEVTDTVIRYDTVIKPIPQYRFVSRIDTVLLTDSDIVFVHDTIKDSGFIQVPIHTSIYEDSTYRAVVTGYHASLDSIMVKNRIITRTIPCTPAKRKKFGVGVSAGYDVIGNCPSITIGLNYNLLSF